MATERGQWGSKLGFILAAAGSAVGLGNLWKFPYITGENGGGAFVIVYLVCIALVGLPIMMGEVLIGRMAQRSTVSAFRHIAPQSAWQSVGWLGVVTGVVILSYYSVVAGWSMHYVYLAVSGGLSGVTEGIEGVDPAAIKATFNAVAADPALNVGWHAVFMALTALIVGAGVQQGVERAARVMMPVLFLMMTALLVYATTLDGFGKAFDFVFGLHFERLTGAGVLEALGHSFFTLSVGMGAMLTYGSYLAKQDDLVSTSVAITLLDTAVALMACLVLFPITFTIGMEPAAGPGLVFQNMPVAFAELPGGATWSVIFFVLLTFAALTSSISLLEVPASYLIDERGWSRPKAVTVMVAAIFALGVPSALSGGTALFGADFQAATKPVLVAMGQEGGKSWFDTFDYLASNILLPVGGMGIALFAAWRIGDKARRAEVAAGSTLGRIEGFYLVWLQLLRYLAPIAILVVMLHALGLL
ncbi:MAG: sodium-dependent transporter [Nannocystaceae bacterium]|nr:sodium-dependent transporter [Myxococcales bacterium]